MALPSDVTFSIEAIDLFERPVRLRLPFRFGAATLDEAPQAFVRARIRLPDGRMASGWAAELMVPKWFDKSPDRSNAGNLDDLRRSLALAAEAYASDRTDRAAFAHAAVHYAPLQLEGGRQGLNALVASYGAALIDRAVLDAMCGALRIDFATAIRANLPRIDATLTPDLRDFAFDAFLDALEPASAIAARHTVGLLDPLSSANVATRPDDDLPVALDEVIARYGNRFFKLKLSGDVRRDVERLTGIAAVLDLPAKYAVTLDGNEQFESVDVVREFWQAVHAEPRLSRLAAATLYLEQPLPRDIALASDVRELARFAPLVIDESEATFDAFCEARQSGYAGVSSKSCKGIYKTFANAARCAYGRHGERPFMTGEDLTAQAGLAFQQDSALAGLVGLTHVERNGHHYVAGFDGQAAPPSEQQAFAQAHPDLYESTPLGTRVLIRNGMIALGSLHAPGFASGAAPDIASLTPLTMAAPSISSGEV
jgi:hypothetical protein